MGKYNDTMEFYVSFGLNAVDYKDYMENYQDILQSNKHKLQVNK